jgi:hypothetical protein
MYPVLIPNSLLGTAVPVDLNDVVAIDRNFPLGPKLFLTDSRWLVTTKEALSRLELLGGWAKAADES